MPTYKILACGGRTVPKGKFDNDFLPSCGWVYENNAIGHGVVNKCPTCGGHLDFAQAADPDLLVEWLKEKNLPVPQWVDDLVHAI